MLKKIELYSHHQGDPTFSDKVFEKTILRFIPQSVTPNHVTVFRYISIPFILYLLIFGYSEWGTALFYIAAISDAVDGALARTRNKITDWGKLNDPLADKLLISAVGAVVVTIFLDFYIIAVIVVIELLLILNAYFKMKKKLKIMSALWPGKLKMIFQSFGIAFVLLYMVFPVAIFLTIATYILYVAIFLGLLSLVIYGSI